MKKRILTMLALCATIMCLAACDNEETNTNATGGTTTATVTATPASKEADTSSTETENNVATTVEPTTAPTVEATVTPTAAPAVPTEVSWEESGMSYELFENPYGADDGMEECVTVIITNNSDTTYFCDYGCFGLEPNGKWYELFYSKDEAESFINTITTNPVKTTVSEYWLTTELPCTITNDNSTAENYEEYRYRTIEFKSDDMIKHFNETTNITLTSDGYSTSYMLFSCTPGFGIIILHDENNEIVAITRTAKPNDYPEFTGEIVLPKDFEFSKMTMLMQYNWMDNSIE